MELKLNEKQEAAVRMAVHASEGHKSVVVRLSGPAGCHACGQGILLYNGEIRTVESIVVGDMLMGPDGNARTVRELRRGAGAMRRIVPVKGASFIVNEDHLLTVVRSAPGAVPEDVTVREWEAIPEVKRRYYKMLRTGVDTFGAPADLLVDPYFLGVLLGDGSMQANVGVSKPDVEILNEVRAQAESYGLAVRTYGIGTSVTHRLSSGSAKGKRRVGRNPLIESLRTLGLYGTECGTRFVPARYKTASRADRLAILAGLLDTDGCLAGANSYDFISKSPQLAADLTFIARSCGFAAYVRPSFKRAQTGDGGIYHRVSISGNTCEIPCRIPRKIAQERQQPKSVLRTGFVVEHAPDDAYFGFTIDGDGRYLLDDFTVTHNTGKTTVLRAISDALGDLSIVAPTGRAALRARELTGQEAQTIHRWLYIPIKNAHGDAVGWRRRPISAGLQAVERPKHGLLVVDESSMVNKKVHDDLMETVEALNVSVLFVGDGYQLPPVQDRDEPPFSIFADDFFCDESVELTEVFRQALESPILRVATAMRLEGWQTGVMRIKRELPGTRGPISADAERARREGDDLIVIVHRNETRFTLNRKIRERFGVPASAGPMPNEPILVRKNSYEAGVFNGEILPFSGWESEPDEESAGQLGLARVNGVRCLMSAMEVSTGKPPPRSEVGRVTRLLQVPYVSANLGHCVTCHSSQGSEWDHAIVALESSLRVMPEEERSRWAYTAITRAKREVRIAFL